MCAASLSYSHARLLSVLFEVPAVDLEGKKKKKRISRLQLKFDAHTNVMVKKRRDVLVFSFHPNEAGLAGLNLLKT